MIRVWSFNFRLSGLLLAVSVLFGCGESGPPRYAVSGKVTFQGQPVPYGTIIFEPDSDKEKSGPSGFAEIRDGQYETTPEGGSINGAVRARITGMDGKVPAGEQASMFPNGMELFPEYVTSVDIPEQGSTHDFEVPSSDSK